MLGNFFEAGEISEIWLTFPDPRPRKKDIGRRLTNNRYLDIYKLLLKEGGLLHFKTDNTGLFDYTLEEMGTRRDIEGLAFTHDLYESDLRPFCYDIKTRYEEMFASQGEKIKYLHFSYRLDRV
jgi:tRNA (guanine-N7-)-methyltransferase